MLSDQDWLVTACCLEEVCASGDAGSGIAENLTSHLRQKWKVNENKEKLNEKKRRLGLDQKVKYSHRTTVLNQ